MRVVSKKDRKRLGACPQCGEIPEHGFARKIVHGIDAGPQTFCEPCRYHLSESRKAKRARIKRPETQCVNCTKPRDGPQKHCSQCRLVRQKSNAHPFTKKLKQDYADTAAAKEKKSAAEAKPARKAKKKEWEQSERGKAMLSEASRRHYEKKKSDPAWALDHKLCTLVRFGLKKRFDSQTVRECTEFGSADDVFAHISLHLQAGMTMQNHGRGVDKWHIGHRIARAMYDHSILDDVKRCWSKANIRPQWEPENLHMSIRLPCDQELIELRSYWPTSWNDQLPCAVRRLELERGARKGPKV